jgi:hypothetical protein
VPDARSDADGDDSRLRRELVDDDSQAVGFLDLPDLDTEAVVDRIVDGFSQLHDDAIVTVYCTHVDAHTLTDLCGSHDLEVVHSVPHDAGRTFVLKRSSSTPNTRP